MPKTSTHTSSEAHHHTDGGETTTVFFFHTTRAGAITPKSTVARSCRLEGCGPRPSSRPFCRPRGCAGRRRRAPWPWARGRGARGGRFACDSTPAGPSGCWASEFLARMIFCRCSARLFCGSLPVQLSWLPVSIMLGWRGAFSLFCRC